VTDSDSPIGFSFWFSSLFVVRFFSTRRLYAIFQGLMAWTVTRPAAYKKTNSKRSPSRSPAIATYIEFSFGCRLAWDKSPVMTATLTRRKFAEPNEYTAENEKVLLLMNSRRSLIGVAWIAHSTVVLTDGTYRECIVVVLFRWMINIRMVTFRVWTRSEMQDAKKKP